MKNNVRLTVLAACIVFSQQMLLFSEQTRVWQDLVDAHLEKCVEVSGVHQNLAARMFSYGEFANDPRLKCFAKCIAQSWGVANDDGTTRTDEFLNLINVNDPALVKASGIEKKCFPIAVENDACETVFQVWKCTWDSLHAAYSAVEVPLMPKQSFSDLKTMWHGCLLQHYHECIEATGADPEKAMRIVMYSEFNEDHKNMCFLQCVLHKLNMVDKLGVAIPDMFNRMIQIHDESILKNLDIASKCYGERKYADSCENGFRVGECVYFTLKNHLESLEHADNQEL